MKVEELLRSQGIAYERREHPTAYTAQEVAAEEHVTGDAFAKPVVVKADGKSYLCVLPASRKIDMTRLAKMLDVDACQLASEEEIATLFPDVEVGAEPPIGRMYGLPTVVDSSLAHREWIVFTADTHRQAIRMRYEDYARIAEPIVADFSVHL